MKIIRTTFKLRRGYSSVWAANNNVLADGEPGFELDTFRLKIGDGKTHWNDLPYTSESLIIKPTKQDFPKVGDETHIYKEESTQLFFYWDTTTSQYEQFGGNGGDVSQIKEINGGNANGI